ncbi:MAG: hypothetical protein ACRDYA_04065 [Egibacteraceae bacterium]
MLRPDEKFVEGCERELAAEGMLRAMLPLVVAEWRTASGWVSPHREPLASR